MSRAIRYDVKHVTEYTYESAVAQSISEAHLIPRSCPGQTVIQSEVSVEPHPRELETRLDYFGNPVSVFSVLESHDRLVVTASSIVDVYPTDLSDLPPVTWEETRQALIEATDDETQAASEFVFDSPFVAAAPELLDYGKASLGPGTPLVDAVTDLSNRIHREFKYRPRATSIDMPLLQILHRRQGVCQDYAHVMIGVLRSYRLAARYVSGYLRSGVEYQGAEASHAWVAVYFPGWGWLELDPTNKVLPSEGHVTVAWGRDYGDVTPVKGVSLGGGSQTVDVGVRVEPVAPETKVPAGLEPDQAEPAAPDAEGPERL